MRAFSGKRQIFSLAIILGCLLILWAIPSIGQTAQPTGTAKTAEKNDNTGWTTKDIILVSGAIFGILFGIFQWFLRYHDQQKKIRLENKVKKDIKKKEQQVQSQTAEQRYRDALIEDLSRIKMIGTEFEFHAVSLGETFVTLDLSFDRYCEKAQVQRLAEKGRAAAEEQHLVFEEQRFLTPDDTLIQAFKQQRLLLVVGDPGSGKTTLLKYYALRCLKDEHHCLGFEEGQVLPLFLPLRELTYTDEGKPRSLHENLAAWAQTRHLDLSKEDFYGWLQDRATLVLLDGLDEISEVEKRRAVCRWVEHIRIGIPKMHMVLTTRLTGYRKIEGIELGCDHARADIRPFSLKQQEDFLKKWYQAVFMAELAPGAEEAEHQQKEKSAQDKAQTICRFLQQEENKGVRELAAVPMLLTIMAIIWKERNYLPDSRGALYDISLNYLLQHRDKNRDLKPLLPADLARKVLAPTALWLQEEKKEDHAARAEMHKFMQPILDGIMGKPSAEAFCKNLRDRAGLLADYAHQRYIFRHKSFMEFLAALQLWKECLGKPKRIDRLIQYFTDNWWEEPIRFFIAQADAQLFDRFMVRFFQSKVSRQLEANKHTLLLNLVKEAPLKRIDGLKGVLSNPKLEDNQRRYVLDCLKAVGTTEAIQTIAEVDKRGWSANNISYAEDMVREYERQSGIAGERIAVVREVTLSKGLDQEGANSFRNPWEYDVEYIKIPGATYEFSVTKKEVTVPDFYLCKYTVTNKRYRRFIDYLAGKEPELHERMPLTIFSQKLLQYAEYVEGYREYLVKDSQDLFKRLRSRYDDDKDFNEGDQPVVGVSWYGARSYCFWLSCLEAVMVHGINLDKIKDLREIAGLYRLPREEEWEWAAGGEADGTIRKYPWAQKKGEPSDLLANYDNIVGKTTPVGRYPEGATPTGLMDMAGNVWEWMANYYHDDDNNSTALRGGSWVVTVNSLRCLARYDLYPRNQWDYNGFRPLRSQS